MVTNHEGHRANSVPSFNEASENQFSYRTRTKISRAYSKITRFLDALIFEHFRKIIIFEPCLFQIYNNFEALFFKTYLIFWPISMYSRHFYGSNIPLKYTVMLWYQQLYLRNKVSMF